MMPQATDIAPVPHPRDRIGADGHAGRIGVDGLADRIGRTGARGDRR
ncbi:hypothetical protein CU044_6889 [Streptomyces sp. L-9-10]|nr:hypothetical protein CU044_6889 [Streptomyces sp. L-9-10]